MTIAETFWQEITARLQAAPLFGVALDRIRREHRTNVTRANCPAVYVVDGAARPTENKACDWKWQAGGKVIVFVRDDQGVTAADDIVAEVVRRINPESTALGVTPYSNGVRLELAEIAPETEIADEDATAIAIELRVSFGTVRWDLETAAR